MTDTDRIVILGGHGKIALLAAPRLTAAGFTVDSVIRKEDQRDDVREAGANPVVLDIETATEEDLAKQFTGAKAVVFSAGAGGGDPQRTHAVDYEAAVRAMKAAQQAGVQRFVIVSYVTAGIDVDRLEEDNSFFPSPRPSTTPTPTCARPSSTTRSSARAASPSTRRASRSRSSTPTARPRAARSPTRRRSPPATTSQP